MINYFLPPADTLRQQADDGEIRFLDIAVLLRELRGYIADLESEEFKSRLLDEAIRRGDGKSYFSYGKCTVSLKETGVRYDYTQTGDDELFERDRVFSSAKKAVEERQKYLKTLPPEGVTVVDTSTGECVTLFPPARRSTTSVIITPKNEGL